MSLPNPVNYKTQNGLIKALGRASELQMDVSLAWWFQSAEYTLRTKFGWEDQEAAIFVSRYKPQNSKYRATS